MARQTQRIGRYDGGMTPDIRSKSGFARMQHWKVFPHKLMQQRSTEADENKAYDIKLFAYAPWSTDYSLFGLGKPAANSRPAIYRHNGAAWEAPTDNEAGSGGTRNTSVFFNYKNGLFGFAGGSALWRYGDLDGVPAFTESYQGISYTTVAQPVYHPADDCAYFFHDNKVSRLNNTTFTANVLTLPSNQKITGGEAQGDYLVIACAPKSGVGSSIVFKWDRDSSLETVSAKLDWGAGTLKHIGNLGGIIIGVTDFFTSHSDGLSEGSLIIKRETANGSETLAEFKLTGQALFYGIPQIIDDKLHWAMTATFNGQEIDGIWSVDQYGHLAVEITEEEASGTSNTVRYSGFIRLGNNWWIAHSNDGSVNRTNDAAIYAYTSYLETNKIGEPNETSQFVGLTVQFEALPSGGSVTVEYKKDAGSWTTLGTQTTAGTTSLYRIHDTSARVPRFSEIQYRVKCTGGVVLTGLEWTHERYADKPYG